MAAVCRLYECLGFQLTQGEERFYDSPGMTVRYYSALLLPGTGKGFPRKEVGSTVVLVHLVKFSGNAVHSIISPGNNSPGLDFIIKSNMHLLCLLLFATSIYS